MSERERERERVRERERKIKVFVVKDTKPKENGVPSSFQDLFSRSGGAAKSVQSSSSAGNTYTNIRNSHGVTGSEVVILMRETFAAAVKMDRVQCCNVKKQVPGMGMSKA